jgi:hypothetical protein
VEDGPLKQAREDTISATASLFAGTIGQLITNIGHAHTRDQEISVVLGLAGIAAEGTSQLPKTSSRVKSRLNAR